LRFIFYDAISLRCHFATPVCLYIRHISSHCV